jgi:hypothetical protein
VVHLQKDLYSQTAPVVGIFPAPTLEVRPKPILPFMSHIYLQTGMTDRDIEKQRENRRGKHLPPTSQPDLLIRGQLLSEFRESHKHKLPSVISCHGVEKYDHRE